VKKNLVGGSCLDGMGDHQLGKFSDARVNHDAMLPGKLDFGSPWVFFLAYNFMKPTTHRVFFGIPVMLWFGGFGLLAGWGLGLRQVVSLALVWLYVPLAWGLFSLIVILFSDLRSLKPGVARAFAFASLFTLSMATVMFLREGFRPPIQLTAGDFPRGDLIWLDLRVLFGVGLMTFLAMILAWRSKSDPASPEEPGTGLS
jgi:hypothetical protein